MWVPNPGPQLAALLSPADELFYGGAAGGGKTDLVIGSALDYHERSLILRRRFPDARAIMERVREIGKSRLGVNEQSKMVRLKDGSGRRLEYGHCQHEKDKEAYQGQPHDLICFDEVTSFTRTMYEFIIRWNRSTTPGQRCRVISTFNPPTRTEGRWVLDYLLPWMAYLYPRSYHHDNPAAPGELRWFARLGDAVVEVEDGTPIEHNGETIHPRSRTFIPARLSDNPFLDRDPHYRSNLQDAPGPLKAMLLYGDMEAGTQDDEWQVIPSEWLKLSHERWKKEGRPKDADGNPVPMSGMGVDVARGGEDKTVIGRLYDNWMEELIAIPGSKTPTGQAVLKYILDVHEGVARIGVDVIGVGAAVVDAIRQYEDEDDPEHSLSVTSINGAAGTKERSRRGNLGFTSFRSMMYWRIREALDPEGEEKLALPDDPHLDAELMAHRWTLTARGIQVEEKKKVKERLGRSPDKADTVGYTLIAGRAKRGGFLA